MWRNILLAFKIMGTIIIFAIRWLIILLCPKERKFIFFLQEKLPDYHFAPHSENVVLYVFYFKRTKYSLSLILLENQNEEPWKKLSSFSKNILMNYWNITYECRDVLGGNFIWGRGIQTQSSNVNSFPQTVKITEQLGPVEMFLSFHKKIL